MAEPSVSYWWVKCVSCSYPFGIDWCILLELTAPASVYVNQTVPGLISDQFGDIFHGWMRNPSYLSITGVWKHRERGDIFGGVVVSKSCSFFRTIFFLGKCNNVAVLSFLYCVLCVYVKCIRETQKQKEKIVFLHKNRMAGYWSIDRLKIWKSLQSLAHHFLSMIGPSCHHVIIMWYFF